MTTKRTPAVKTVSNSAALASPLIIFGALSALAGLAYVIWTKREQIKNFVEEQDFHPLDQITDFVTDTLEKVSGDSALDGQGK